jgi:trimeric autotransporter adhesin
MFTCAVSSGHRLPSASALALSLLLSACGGSGTNAPAATYSLEGSVSGLVGSGLVLSVAANSSGSASVAANGTVDLAKAVAANTRYTVTVATQPSSPAQVCSVTNGSGTISNTNVTNVAISCAAPVAAPPPATGLPITATVTGLPGPGLMLELNVYPGGPYFLTINANGVATFPVQLPANTNFDAFVDGSPPGGFCNVDPTAGVVSSTGANISVMCGLGYSVSYTVSGLSGSGLVLQLNGASIQSSPRLNGMFSFYSLFSSGTSYTVSVVAQPTSPTQICSVVNATGTIGNANVTNVQVNCTPAIVGTAYGVVGTGLTLQLNGSGNVPVTQSGPFSGFPPAIPTGTPYTITVATQPSAPTQDCTLNNAQGTIGTANVTNLQVICLTPASGAIPAAHNAYFIGTASNTTTNSVVLVVPTNDSGIVVTPSSSLVPINPSDAFVSVATDATGNIYVGAVTTQMGTPNAQTSDPRILMFPPGSTGAATPNRTIQLPAGSTPGAIAVDGTGNIYVSDSNMIYEFATGASGTATPTRSLATGCTFLAVDLNANIACADGQTVMVFAPTQSGSATPTRTIEPGQAFVVDPDDIAGSIGGLALDPTGNIFMVVSGGGTLRQQSLFEAAGGTTSSDQGSLVGSVNSVLSNYNPGLAFAPFAAIQFDAAGNLYINERVAGAESILWQFAPRNNGLALATSEAINGSVGSFVIH